MAIKIISGTVYSVDTELSTDAWNIFKKYSDGTATPEEIALITNTQETAFEVKVEGEAPIEPEA